MDKRFIPTKQALEAQRDDLKAKLKEVESQLSELGKSDKPKASSKSAKDSK